MTPAELLHHSDSGTLWGSPLAAPALDVPSAYQLALAVRALRLGRGEQPRGFKIGFTNRSIWARYDVFGPIWGTVYDSTLRHCEGRGELSLSQTCQPRLEPEAVFGMGATPPAAATLDDLFAAIDWVAPGFEVVQSHMKDWKFKAAATVADGGLHGRLLVGRRVPVRDIAANAQQFDALLASCQVSLSKHGQAVEQGCGANVLDSPLRALHFFLTELRQCPGAPELLPGDVVTTGTWTDAWPVQAGESWRASFGAPLGSLEVDFTA
ncbi:2-hydroxypenta-2,4-dienoate hydratase [Comamonadaceae bacterium]|nr:2-hydroxypenta-2,4-dienoate hydratase [Comamonadaceae bacterium]